MLDLGAGQGLRQMAYFAARGNSVVGVDRDLIVQGFDPRGYIRMARSNGTKRAAKTLARKALGIDARYRREFARQLGTKRRHGEMTVHQMDAVAMALPDSSFDFLYSFRVFQHLQEPARVAREIARVVAPGGGVYLAFLPYTATNGCLDRRMLAGHGDELPPWPHLRPEYNGLVHQSGYLNKLRLDDWRRLFEDAMPGSTLVVEPSDSRELKAHVNQLRAEGSLLDYTLEELLATNACLYWRRSA
jgi:SAM-dependent methyltransferase